MKRYGITDITLGLCRDLGREGHAVRDAEVEIGFSALALAMVPRPVRTRQTDFLFSAARAPMTSLEKKKKNEKKTWIAGCGEASGERRQRGWRAGGGGECGSGCRRSRYSPHIGKPSVAQFAVEKEQVGRQYYVIVRLNGSRCVRACVCE